MRLYLLRHGEANPKSEDPQRGLSDRGRAEVQAVSTVFARTYPRIQAVEHSPKPWAEQSAAILASVLQIRERPRVREDLSANDPVQPLAEQLQQAQTDLVLVGHLPHLGKLASLLLTGGEIELFDLPPAGLACLERSGDSWRLLWLLTPGLCKTTY